ncbi:MAG: hypothetical protein KJ607_12690, partial [Bacteroidetes bacterium]|nr:hypothetical protein [Bacteroidota bacterium]
MQRPSIIYLLTILLLSRAFAGNENYTSAPLSGSDSTLCPGSHVTVTDPRLQYMLIYAATWPGEFVNRSVKNKVVLYVNYACDTIVNEYTAKVCFHIYRTSETGSVDSVHNLCLNVEYDTSKLATRTTDVFLAVDGGHHLRVVIDSVIINGQVMDSCSNIPANLDMKAEIDIERHYRFETGYSQSIATEFETDLVAEEDVVIFRWDHYEGAEAFDLEWAFIDKYSAQNNTVSFDFRKNSTRIRTALNHYKIPLLYPDGYIICRIRGIGADIDNNCKMITGQWSKPHQFTTGTDASDFLYAVEGLEPVKNWQSSVIYAEEGKRKEIITYYDGTLRERQSVTKINTANTAVIGQTFCDFYGRPAIEALPVPSPDDPDMSYREKFNISNDSLYSYRNFDLDNTAACTLTRTDRMDSTSGAAKYYSANNPYTTINDPLALTAENDYIPSAAGFPFFQTEYTPDQTGRICRKGGAGFYHQLAGTDENGNTIGGHETKFFYAVPYQEELDKLFGNEIGNNVHYEKNAIIDANGQVSVEYKDMKGKTIATALAGDPAVNPNLDALPSAGAANMSVNLLDSSQFIPGQLAYVCSRKHLVTAQSQHLTEYKLAGVPLFQYGSCLFEPVYRLSINISNACQNTVLSPPVDTVIGDTALSSLSVNSFSMTDTAILDLGVYHIVKRLQVDTSVIDDYFRRYVNTCLALNLDSFLNSGANPYSVSDPCNCFTGCNECIDSADAYYQAHNDQIQAGSLGYDFMSSQEYQQALEDCAVPPCSDLNTNCDIFYRMMLVDVSPYGQYADTAGCAMNGSATDPYSIFSSSGSGIMNYQDPGLVYDPSTVIVFPDDQSSPVTVAVQDLTIEQFLYCWHDSWAGTLAQNFHPEYCYYQPFCRDLEPSHNYDMDMMLCESAQQAYDNGYFNPLDIYDNSVPEIPLPANPAPDPIYMVITPVASSILSSVVVKMIHFYSQGSLEGTIWQMIYNLRDPSETYPPNFYTDNEWTLFKGMYLSLKQQFLADEAYDYPACPDPSIDFSTDTVHERRFIFDVPEAINNILADNNIDISLSDPADTANMNQAADSILAYIGDQCTSVCEYQAGMWMQGLQFCHLLPADSLILQQELIEICTNGCAEGNPMGASGANTPSANGNYSFEDAMVWFTYTFPQYSLSDSCNSLLINIPFTPPSYTVDTLDTCTCELIEMNRQNYLSLANGALPAGVATEAELFNYTYHADIELQHLKCYCTYLGYSFAGLDSAICSDYSLVHCDSAEIAGVLNNVRTDMASSIEQFNANNYYYVISFHNGTNYISEMKFGLQLEPCYYDLIIHMIENAPTGLTTSSTIDSITNIQLNMYSSDVFTAGMYINGMETPLPVTGRGIRCNTICNQVPPLTLIPSRLTCGHCLLCYQLGQIFDDFTAHYSYLNTQDTIQYFNYFSNYLNSVHHLDFNGFELQDYYYNQCPANSLLQICPDTQADTCPCADFNISSAYDYAYWLYHEYLDSLSNDFTTQYISHCLTGINETFTMQYMNNEYHYTLYYYDRAGNLIKTVPPQGVSPLLVSELQASLAHRANPSLPYIYPAHKLRTHYRYNSLDQPFYRDSPDAGETGFWYDKKGQLIASRSEEQAQLKNYPEYNLQGYTYNYIKYDYLGRTVEHGEALFSGLISDAQIHAGNFPDDLPNEKLSFVKIHYNNAPYSVYGFDQKNLRNRIATVEKYERLYYFPPAGNYNIPVQDTFFIRGSTFYTYDIHGNVRSLLSEVPSLAGFDLRFQKTDYAYDLISGNVTGFSYQSGKPDAFFHRYEYDADNRITNVYTSKDSIIWQQDAKYFYYLHGPLTRTEIGEHKIQGLDYAYTLQGWLKGVNSVTLAPGRDMGRDGLSPVHEHTGRDAFGYRLDYYAEDYTPVGGNSDFLSDMSSL